MLINAVADPGERRGQGGHGCPIDLSKNSNKNGYQARRLIFHGSWPPSKFLDLLLEWYNH